MTHPDYQWQVDEDGFFHSAHLTWADAMRAVDEALRTITVTLPPYSDRYTIDVYGGHAVRVYEFYEQVVINGVGTEAIIGLTRDEIKPIALALLAIDRRNKEEKK